MMATSSRCPTYALMLICKPQLLQLSGKHVPQQNVKKLQLVTEHNSGKLQSFMLRALCIASKNLSDSYMCPDLQALAKYKQIHGSYPLNVECLRYLVHLCGELGTHDG